jgi:hypothetical protein
MHLYSRIGYVNLYPASADNIVYMQTACHIAVAKVSSSLQSLS